ncbi:DoxX family protein [Novosphingobium beihaiensis]|uniref:DoxX family protein n=1 Tax=Novosphingobium beihaiensis TaxID=2930389 RepID=A0ABT0BKQ6_9SPHN|nr:DoxX family protein [Novosphingobium beihaiensis]MCJ2185635.1 DoxX family protein [Novosphingobium beihaiensis]
MQGVLALWQRITGVLQGRVIEGIALLLVRVALAGVFWRSGRSKVVEGTWLQVSDTTNYLFENDYSAVPLPPEFAAHMAVAAETLFPILLVAGAATRLSALALLGMTMVIQVFVFPEAWWSVHILWTAMALTLIVRGGGLFALDTVGLRVMPR